MRQGHSLTGDTMVRRLEQCYSGAVYDSMREAGIEDTVLHNEIRPVGTGSLVAGQIFTMSGSRGEYTPDESLLAWTGFLSEAPRGSVVVCQPNDHTLAHMGELSGEVLKHRGIRGFIVDGGCRDTEFLRSIGFPVFARYTTPADIVGRWAVTSLGEPIRIGPVEIRSGDYVLGDPDGVVVIPGESAEQIVARAEELMGTESDLRRELRSGRDPREAYLEYRIF